MRVAVLLSLCAIMASTSASATRARRLWPAQVYVFVHVYDTVQPLSDHENYRVLMKPPCPAGSEGCLMDPSEVRRGAVATFAISNVGKKPHSFTVFGRTRMIEP